MVGVPLHPAAHAREPRHPVVPDDVIASTGRRYSLQRESISLAEEQYIAFVNQVVRSRNRRAPRRCSSCWWPISPRAACQRCPPTPTGRPHCTCRRYSGPRTLCCQSSAGTSPTCPSKNPRRRERRSCLSRRAPAGVRAVAAVVAVPGGARIVGRRGEGA